MYNTKELTRERAVAQATTVKRMQNFILDWIGESISKWIYWCLNHRFRTSFYTSLKQFLYRKRHWFPLWSLLTTKHVRKMSTERSRFVAEDAMGSCCGSFGKMKITKPFIKNVCTFLFLLTSSLVWALYLLLKCMCLYLCIKMCPSLVDDFLIKWS